MRLFIAIELPKPVKEALVGIQREVKSKSAGGRFVAPEGFHLTLRFIGESNALAEAAAAMREATRGIRPFMLKLGQYGCFDRDTGATGFVNVNGDLKELGILREALRCAMFDRGFSRERGRFTPHITLGRNIVHDELTLGELKAMPAINATMTVNGITLFESVRGMGNAVERGMVYHALHKERF